MSLFEHHIFVCMNQREASDPRGCCASKGSESLLESFRLELKNRGLKGTVRVNKAGCLDQCALGPVVVIYPSATWYVNVQAKDVPDLVSAMVEKRHVDRLLHPKMKL